MIRNITLRNFTQSPLMFCVQAPAATMQTKLLTPKTTYNHFAHQKGEIRQPPFSFSQQIFASHVLQLTIILLQVESKGDKVDLSDQRNRGKKFNNIENINNNKKITNPKIKYRQLLVPLMVFRKSNKHRLLARKSEVYVIHKILRLLPKVYGVLQRLQMAPEEIILNNNNKKLTRNHKLHLFWHKTCIFLGIKYLSFY